MLVFQKFNFHFIYMTIIKIINMTVLALFFLISSCSKELKKDQSLITKQIEIINSALNMGQYFDGIEYKVFNLPDSLVIGDISAYYKLDKIQIIVDNRHSKSVYIFDKKNNFLKKINKIGLGPEEYLKIVSSSIDDIKKHLYIFDRQKINIYTIPEFKFVKSINVAGLGGIADMIYFEGYVYLYSISKYSNKLGLLGRINTTTNRHEVLLKNVPDILDRSSWIGKKQFSKTKDALYFIPSFSKYIYKIDLSGKISPYYVLKNKDIIPDFSTYIKKDITRPMIFKKINNYYSIMYSFSIANDSLLCLSMPYKNNMYHAFSKMSSPKIKFYNYFKNDIDIRLENKSLNGDFVFTNINRYVEVVQSAALINIFLKEIPNKSLAIQKNIKSVKIRDFLKKLKVKNNPFLLIYN